MDQVIITDLVARGINIVLFTDLYQAGQSNDVNDSLDYR